MRNITSLPLQGPLGGDQKIIGLGLGLAHQFALGLDDYSLEVRALNNV